ncbi:MAG: thiamine diphosphokinase [Treponema sp.]|nr:thiamine diphosphokinase [Treponema sp.]
MLGIIFTGGDGPPSQIVKPLLKEDALIVAADSGLIAAEKAGFKPHWVIGDMDSLGDTDVSSGERLASYPKERIIRAEQNKDYTDTELAVSHIIEQGCDSFWIIGGGGGRIDHLFGIRSLLERDIFPSRWITDTADIRCFEDEINCVLEKDALVSVFPLGDGPWQAKSSGLKWQLDALPWDRGFFGLSNRVTDGEFSIKAQSGRFMVILPLRRI